MTGLMLFLVTIDDRDDQSGEKERCVVELMQVRGFKDDCAVLWDWPDGGAISSAE